MFSKSSTTQPVADPSPPTPQQVFNGAAASSAYARSTFQDAVDELTDANEALDEVVARTTSEIDSLTDLCEAATAQRIANEITVEKLQALIG